MWKPLTISLMLIVLLGSTVPVSAAPIPPQGAVPTNGEALQLKLVPALQNTDTNGVRPGQSDAGDYTCHECPPLGPIWTYVQNNNPEVLVIRSYSLITPTAITVAGVATQNPPLPSPGNEFEGVIYGVPTDTVVMRGTILFEGCVTSREFTVMRLPEGDRPYAVELPVLYGLGTVTATANYSGALVTITPHWGTEDLLRGEVFTPTNDFPPFKGEDLYLNSAIGGNLFQGVPLTNTPQVEISTAVPLWNVSLGHATENLHPIGTGGTRSRVRLSLDGPASFEVLGQLIESRVYLPNLIRETVGH